MIESLIKNLNQDIALLQLRIQRDKGAGFNDMSRLLESMTIQFFKVLGLANLKSMNQIRVNYPAIDAADDDRDGGIAVQITSNASASKIKKTISAFEKKDSAGRCFADKYSSLYIFGFCKSSTKAVVPSYCKVIGTDFLVGTLIDLNSELPVQEMLESVRHHVDYSSLHPYGDVECLKIVLAYVGRNAIRHRMVCEGSVDEMSKGLREISELIGKGTVSGKKKSKAHHEFIDQNISQFLLFVLDQIGGITAIVNRSSRNGFVYLNGQDLNSIDMRKQAISKSAQEIALRFKIASPLGMHPVD